MVEPDSSDSRKAAGVSRELDYHREGVPAEGQLLIWMAAAFCVVALGLLFIDPEVASIPGLISVVIGFIAYWRRRKIIAKTSSDAGIIVIILLGIVGVLPSAWYTWTISGWAQPDSSRKADELMDRGKVILEACRIYASKHGGAYPKNLAALVRDSLLPVSVIGPCTATAPSDVEIENCSEFLYFGEDLHNSWASSRQVILLLSAKSFAKYGGPGRAIGYGDGQSLFCFDRDLPDVVAICNRARAANALPPITP